MLEARQLTLDDLKPMTIAHSHRRCLADRYDAWRYMNGHVYAAFRAECWRLRHDGAKRISAKGVAEDLRRSWLKSHGDFYRINNSFIAPMVRELVKEDESWREYFEVRKRI